jgi:hypothetical protein
VLDQNGYAHFTTLRDDGAFEIDIGARGDPPPDDSGADASEI